MLCHVRATVAVAISFPLSMVLLRMLAFARTMAIAIGMRLDVAIIVV